MEPQQNKPTPNKHMLLMVLGCIVPLVALYAASTYFGLNADYLVWATILLCIGMHIWMMKEHKGGHTH